MKTDGSKKVSIVTPVHNDSAFIRQTIDSVLAQTHKNWEMLIVDDCSTDDSASVIATYQDERIRYFRNEKNMGAAYSRNRALREAKGDYIAFLDGDDWWAPTKLERQLAFMEKLQIQFSCTAYYRCYENGPEGSNRPIVQAPWIIGKKLMLKCDYVGCLTAMYDAKAIGLIQISPDIKKRNDYAIWLHVCQKANCYFLSEPLAYYRVRKNSISRVSGWKLLKHHQFLFKTEMHYGWFHSWFCALRNAYWAVKKKKEYVTNTPLDSVYC